ncbi:DNA-processing protein DprA, partial [candidate division WOR-3 bacterium]|nr:DNA-processing protein DprA [candidate division WOR-3 bacterium]
MNRNFYWLALSKVNGIGNKTLIDISERNKEKGVGIEEFWNLEESRMSEQYTIRKPVIEEIIKKRENYADINALQQEINTKGVKIITIEDESYPAQLKEMDEPPFILYAYGNINFLNDNLVAIVGSRDISNEGLALTYKFSNLLMEQGITVLRGDTRDIDTITHIAAKDTKGFEIIVLSGGILANLYKLEKSNKQIDPSKTLMLSFTDPNLHWTPYGERRRNQIVFSMSENIIVVEAREGGIIMDEGIKALEKGKKMFVVRYEEYPKNASANKFL